MRKLNLKILTSEEYIFLKSKKPNGVYSLETQKILNGIIEKLELGKKHASRCEKKLCKIYDHTDFGILIDTNSKTGKKSLIQEKCRFRESSREKFLHRQF